MSASDEFNEMCIQCRLQLTVHLDRYEVLIEQCSDLRAFITLPLHHMTPVAGEVTAGDKQQFIARPGCGQRRFTPWLPGDRILAVQRKIRGGVVAQLIDQARQKRQRIEQEYGEYQCSAHMTVDLVPPHPEDSLSVTLHRAQGCSE